MTHPMNTPRTEMDELVAKIEARFKPDYMGPVERAHITSDEWATLAALVADGGWLPIEDAPENVEVWCFDADTDPQQYAAVLTERDPDIGGFYWRPAEELVADMLDYELCPTHYRPLPPPPNAARAGDSHD